MLHKRGNVIVNDQKIATQGQPENGTQRWLESKSTVGHTRNCLPKVGLQTAALCTDSITTDL